MISSRTASTRNALGIIGLAVAIMIGVVLPLAYGLFDYDERARVLSFKARLGADRVAKYVYGRERLWQYQALRLEEVLQLPAESGDLRQRVEDASGRTVYDSGQTIQAPVLRSRVPILVESTVVGYLHAEESLSGFVETLLLAFLISSGIGIGVYLIFRALPLRALDATLGELKTQNTRFEVALNNMSQGLCLFDKDQRLVICNHRYAELYQLPADLTRSGTSLRDIMRHRIAVGKYAGEDREGHAQERYDVVNGGMPATQIYDYHDGGSVVIKHEPLPDGGWVATHEDITEQRRAQAQIAHLAHHDALTDLPNRALLKQRLQEARTIVARGGSVAVLCLDLDRFKEVNDTLGHAIGDALLKQIGDRLRDCVRTSDTVARVGGDEFAIVQTDAVQPQAATALAERLIESITAPIDIDGHQILVGTSVGISIAPDDTEDTGLLLKNADLALYQVKGQGRGAYRFFEPAMDARMHARRQTEIDLRRAIADGGFELHYQPILNLDQCGVSTFEALLRWNRPGHGMVSPADFIPLSEETGMIVPIGEWVLRAACTEAATWPGNIPVSVNLSPAQFQHGDLVALVRRALADAKLPAERLELEITESILLENTEATLTILNGLRNVGVRIAMDDFGIGFSSLRSISTFPFNKIKIDQSFVAELGKSEHASAIIEAVAMLGARLEMTITAEGVETSEQLAWLRALGVTEVQGYLINRPQPASEVGGMLSAAPLAIRAAA